MWQLIETAPKDMTPFLGYAAGEMTVVQWYSPPGLPGIGYWSLAVCGSYAEDSEWSPTHWQALPSPPEAG